MPSFFTTVTRFLPSATRDPREESLTEIFAEVLRRVPGAAGAIAEKCGMAGLEDTPSTVRTQRPAAGLQRVDLEIRFDAPDTVPRRLWLELKWTAPPDRAQRDGYEKELRMIGHEEDRAIIIAPWALHADRLEAIDGELWRTWTDVGLLLEELDTDQDLVAAWMKQDFLDYLEENDLSSHQGLALEHLATIHALDAARERFVALVDRMDQRLEERWAVSAWEHTSAPLRHERLQHWRMHYPTITDPDAARLGVNWIGIEFHVRPAPHDHPLRAAWALGSGFKAKSPAGAPRLLHEACVGRLASDGAQKFLMHETGQNEWFVMRYLPLTAVLGEQSLDEQVKRLVDFAEESWAVLSARPDFP